MHVVGFRNQNIPLSNTRRDVVCDGGVRVALGLTVNSVRRFSANRLTPLH
jgi:hypothetical protein